MHLVTDALSTGSNHLLLIGQLITCLRIHNKSYLHTHLLWYQPPYVFHSYLRSLLVIRSPDGATRNQWSVGPRVPVCELVNSWLLPELVRVSQVKLLEPDVKPADKHSVAKPVRLTAQNNLEWEASIGPGETKELVLKYSVEYPAGEEIL